MHDCVDIMHRSTMNEDRQRSLTEIISNGRITSQAEIVRLLKKKGFVVTQASVSRDLERLRVRKESGIYQIGRGEGLNGQFGTVSFALSGDNLVVVRCDSGLASALAVRIDGSKLPEIIGTIAGDDTVFVAVSNRSGQLRVIKALKGIFGG
jgi:transcriptional regulator of arginine metabolism